MQCPIVMKSPLFGFEIKGKQHNKGTFVTPKLMHSIRSLYIVREFADNLENNFWFMVSFISQQYYKFIANFYPKTATQVPTKNRKTSFFVFLANLNVLHCWRDFNCCSIFAVIVLPLNECVHVFNIVYMKTVKTKLQRVNFWRFWKLFLKKLELHLCNILVHWRPG